MEDWQLSEASYVRLDLFPANVTEPGGSGPYTNKARVIITDKHFYVFEDSKTGPACTASGTIYDASGDNRSGYEIVDDEMGAWKVSRSTNCGCGSRLRGFRPFPGVPYARF